jgi:hypothetical protein
LKSKKDDTYWFGLPALKNTELCWGARAACRNTGPFRRGEESKYWLEFYPDRQQFDKKDHPQKKELQAWINSLGLSDFKRVPYYDGDPVEFNKDTFHLRGEARGGYVYVVAWIQKEKKVVNRKGKDRRTAGVPAR